MIKGMCAILEDIILGSIPNSTKSIFVSLIELLDTLNEDLKNLMLELFLEAGEFLHC